MECVFIGLPSDVGGQQQHCNGSKAPNASLMRVFIPSTGERSINNFKGAVLTIRHQRSWNRSTYIESLPKEASVPTEHKPGGGSARTVGPRHGGTGDLAGPFPLRLFRARLPAGLLTVQGTVSAEASLQRQHSSSSAAAAALRLSARFIPSPSRSLHFIIRHRARHLTTAAGKGREPGMAAAVVAAGRACARGALRAAWRGDGAGGAGAASAGRAAATGTGREAGGIPAGRGDRAQGAHTDICPWAHLGIRGHIQTSMGTSGHPWANPGIHGHIQASIGTSRHLSMGPHRHPWAHTDISPWAHPHPWAHHHPWAHGSSAVTF